MAKYLSCKETAALLRAELKEKFPGVKFSVRSSVYSGGASIYMNWTDGPSVARVDQVAKRYAGASFDGMIDLKSYHSTIYNGEEVHMGADYVFTSRENSDEAIAKACAEVAKEYAGNLAEQGLELNAAAFRAGDYSYIGIGGRVYGHWSWQQIIYRQLAKMGEQPQPEECEMAVAA